MADRVIKFRGEFDASQILASLKQIRSEMEKSGASPNLFKSIDKDIEKAEGMVKELTVQINNGFKNTKELDAFGRKFDAFGKLCGKVELGLKDVNKAANFKISDSSIDELNKSLELLKERQEETSKKSTAAISNIKNISAKTRLELTTAAKDGNLLLEVYEKLATLNFEKGLSTLNKVMQKNPVEENFVSKYGEENFSKLFTTKGAGQKYAETLYKIATTSISVKDAFDQLKAGLNELDKEFVESEAFVLSYMENLKALAMAAVGNNNLYKGSVTKAINTMTAIGTLNTTGGVTANNENTLALHEQFLLMSQTSKIEEEIKHKSEENTKKATAEQEKYNASLQRSAENLKGLNKVVLQNIEDTKKLINVLNTLDDSFNYISNTIKRLFSLTTAWRSLRNQIRATFNDIKLLDKAFGSIAMVTGYTVSELWDLYGTYAALANKLGQTTKGVIEASSLYYQQGLETAEVMSLTEETMKLATLAGLDFKEATSLMTAAIRAFKLEMTDGAHVTDVYAELAAHAAASVNDISQAMSATAAIAHSAGMEFETTAAMLTTMIEATQEAPKNLGTALKAVIARFTELKENVAGTKLSEFDDLNYNKVDKALKSVGISLKDVNGLFRDLDDVFRELAGKWDTLDRNSQRYVATIAAGSRQQSRFIALMENSARTEELIETAYDSAGKSSKLFAKFLDTVEYKVNQLKNTWEQVRTSFLDSSFYSGAIKGLTAIAEKFKGFDWKKLLIVGPIFLTTGKMMAKLILGGLSLGLLHGKNGISWVINKIFKNKLNAIVKIEADISSALYTVDILDNYLKQFSQDEITNIGAIKDQIFDLEHSTKQLTEADKNNLKALKEIAAAYEEATQKGGSFTENFKDNLQGRVNNFTSDLRASETNLRIAKFGKGLASAVGYSVSTGLMMGLNGNFDASEILRTTMVQSFSGAFSSLMSGQWSLLAGLAVIGAVSLGMSFIADYFEELAEKAKMTANAVYKYEKQIEQLEEKLEKLNETLDKVNKLYDDLKELYDNFTDAKEAYEELSLKIGLTEEEQEKLNKATLTLIDLHPELLAGYTALGEAILNIGAAWDKAAEKEELYWDKILKLLAELELKTAAGLLALNLANADKNKAYRELQKAIVDDTLDTRSNHWSDAANPWMIPEGFKLSEVLNVEEWDVNLSGADAEGYIKKLIEKSLAFRDFFVESFNLFAGTTYNSEDYEKVLDDLNHNYDDFYNATGEAYEKEKEMWQDFSKVLQANREDLKDIIANEEESEKLLEQDTKNAAETYKTSMINSLKYEIKALDLTEQELKLLLSILSKDISTDKITEDLLSEKYRTSNGTFLLSIFAKDMNEQVKNLVNGDIAQNFKDLTDYQSNLIAEYYDKLYTSSKEELEQFKEKMRSAGISNVVIDDLDPQDLLETFNKNNETLAKYFGDNYENSALYKSFNKLGINYLKAFLEGFNRLGDKKGSITATFVEEMLQNATEEIDANMIANLANIKWEDLDVLSLKTAKETFLDFAEELGIALDKAKEYWNEYKDFMSKLNVLDIAKENLSTDALLDALDEDLNEKLKSAKITSSIESSLKNGFMTFSESNEFRDTCEKLGLKASDYIEIGLNGMEKINVDKFKKAIEDQVLNEKEIVELLRLEYDLKVDEYNLLATILRTEAKKIDALNEEVKIAHAYKEEMEAAAAASLSAAAGHLVEYTGKEVTWTFSSSDEAYAAADDLEKKAEETENWIKENLQEGSEFMTEYMARLNSYSYEVLVAIANGEKSAAEGVDILTLAFKDLQDAVKNLDRAQKDLVNQQHSLEKAERKAYEAEHGSKYYQNKLDSLNNYSALLDDINSKVTRARDSLDDLSSNDNVGELLKTYVSETHNDIVARKAENLAIKEAMANTEKTLQIYSDYWYKIGDLYYLDINKLNNADMPDQYKNFIEDLIALLRDYKKTVEDNEDAITKARKQFEKDEKAALESYVNLEKEVVDTLKEQYEKQVNDLKNKYDAMKDADDDYLDALEDAIKKERDLRNRLNEWDDLATKEKKLSLMRRDTSGSKLLEIAKMEKEVQEDRTKLLDDTIDDVIDGLKEMYELLQESREAEIEYMESMIDNAELIKEANKIITELFTSSDKVVAWFLDNKDLTEMSEALIELEKKNWTDLYNDKVKYEELTKIDLLKYLKTTADEISKTMDTISTDISDKSKTTLDLVKEAADEAIWDANEALRSAELSYTDSLLALEQLKRTAYASEQFYYWLCEKLGFVPLTNDFIKTIFGEDKEIGNLTDTEIALAMAVLLATNSISESLEKTAKIYNGSEIKHPITSNTIGSEEIKYDGIRVQIPSSLVSNESTNKSTSSQEIILTTRGQELTNSYKKAKVDIERNAISSTGLAEGYQWDEGLGTFVPKHSDIIYEALMDEWKNGNHLDSDRITTSTLGLSWELIENLIKRLKALDLYPMFDKLKNTITITMKKAEEVSKNSSKHFASGGLVNYTGPAWVDGSPSAPEAFLNSEDTRRIGEAAKLLADLPALNGNISLNISTSTVGDTTIALTVNFDSISEEYDAERVIDLMKQKIVEAAHFAGSNVILQQ